MEYTLVTPAKNEEGYIERTIEAVVSQTVLPKKWVVVSDGSLDRTDEIVRSYAQKHTFIHLKRAGENGQKDFGSKVRAFQAGYDELRSTSYDFVGNLDADVTFDANYYEQILQRFQANPRLGVGGGIVLELAGNQFMTQHMSSNSVAGAVQLFRRHCYEAFGGYIPIKGGGIDAAAEIMARMHSWEVQTFPEIHVYHHRRVSTGNTTILSGKFRQGVTNYLLGYHPLFQIASCLSRALDRPFLIGSACTLLGYGWSCLKRSKRVLPDEVIRFLRAEQMARITSSFPTRNAVRGG